MIRKIIICGVSLLLVLALTGCEISIEDIGKLTSQIFTEQSADTSVQKEYFSEVPDMPKPEGKGYTLLKYENETYIYSLPFDSEEASQLFIDYFFLLKKENFSLDMPTEYPCFAVNKIIDYESVSLAVVAMQVLEDDIRLLICFDDEVIAQFYQ